MGARTNDRAEGAEPRGTSTGTGTGPGTGAVPAGPAAGAANGSAAGAANGPAAGAANGAVPSPGPEAPAPAEAPAKGGNAQAADASAANGSGGPRSGGRGADSAAQAAARESGSPRPDEADVVADPAPAPDPAPEARGAVRAPGPNGEPVRTTRRFPSVTLDTARPEGGGRAAPGDAPAPARQWPLLTVLTLTGLGLVFVGIDAFADAFRVGTILIGVALVTGAVLRRILPSVGMLAVRSRFTDMVTYGLLGTTIVLLALVTQPKPWLDVPFLEDAVHFTVR